MKTYEKLETFDAKVKAKLKNGEIKIIENVYFETYAKVNSWWEHRINDCYEHLQEFDEDLENIIPETIEADEEIDKILEIISCSYDTVEVYE